MPTQVQVRGAVEATQEARTLVSRELDVNTTDGRISIHNGSTAGGIPHTNFIDVQNQEYNYATASGTDTITIALNKAPSAYAAGQRFVFRAANTNTGSATLNVNSLGAKTIKKKDVINTAVSVLAAGDIIQNAIYTVFYDGTDFIIDSVDAGSGGVISQTVISGSPTTVDISGVFSIDKNYRVVFENLIPSANGSKFSIRLEVASSFVSTSSYEYIYRRIVGTNNNQTNGTSTSFEIGTNVGTDGNESFSGDIYLYNPVATATTKAKSSTIWENASSNIDCYDNFLLFTNTGAVTGIQFISTSALQNTGRIVIYED